MYVTVLYDQSSQNTLASIVNEAIQRELSDIQTIKWYAVNKDAIMPCIGCFNCWIKTPGKCMMKDVTTAINEDIIRINIVIYVTPIIYGSYSTAIKRTLDHIVPILLPFFKKSKGEVHHEQRYSKRPNFMMLAYNETITSEERETFIALTQANSVNLDIPNPKVYFCSAKKDILQTIGEIKSSLLKYTQGGKA
ncbi:MAG: hypothetical protein K0S71_772 [Clostridia bacterium]|jgi:multimeric flavodoxin WrbA|nr:hypothetical protein [Clostridia bacterium]